MHVGMPEVVKRLRKENKRLYSLASWISAIQRVVQRAEI